MGDKREVDRSVLDSGQSWFGDSSSSIAEDPDATPSTSTSSAACSDPVPFPVQDWDRYEPVRLLGQGGMGMVFLARDLRLGRDTALKFVRGENAAHTARLLSEARAQARVEHERVCKVYEVGEIQGLAYIAMQFIDGQPLDEACADMSFEQRAMAIRDAAEGVNEAHRAGIIHRDIKPSNIMVERTEDGRFRTYVVDFGLAKDWTSGQTETGTLMGTPWYMAPEQARGEVSRLDRRADVYGLGAALYHVLADAPPIPGDNALSVLSNIPDYEPRPLRSLDPDIPQDLEAIAQMCLEKDRSERYDSARALVEDLDRFLDGEPVKARRAGLQYRVRKRLRKHWRLATAASVALVLLLIALGWGLKTRAESTQKAQLAARFSELVEQIDAMARLSALSPLHDIRSDQDRIRQRMAELSSEIDRGGELAMGPGLYALGRGHLALGDYDAARESLEAAWAQGYREPRTAYALALVMGHLYSNALAKADNIQDKKQRAAKRQEVQQTYRGPTLAYLAQSTGPEVPSQEYVGALVAFYEGRYDDALSKLDQVSSELSWFYEAPTLRGEVLTARALERWDSGDREGALADFDAGREAYRAAAAIGESAPDVHEALGELEARALWMEMFGQGGVQAPFEQGVAAAERALTAQPDYDQALMLEAKLSRHYAQHQSDRGEPAEALLQQAIDSAEAAAAIAPGDSETREELGKSYYQLAAYQQEQNSDPRPMLTKAIESFDAIPPEDRDYHYFVARALTFQTWGDYEDMVGEDSSARVDQTIDAYLEAARADASKLEAWINLGATYLARSFNPDNTDPKGDLGRALEAMEKAAELNPQHFVPHFYLGEIHAVRAARARSAGGDPLPDLRGALDAYRQGLAINADSWHLHSGVGSALLDQAVLSWDRGQPPGVLFDQALAAYQQAAEAAPGQANIHNNIGYLHIRRALCEFAAGRDPSASAAAAVTATRHALELSPDLPMPWGNLGMVHALLAAEELRQGRDPRPQVAQAQQALDRALELDPTEVDSNRSLAWIHATTGSWKAQRGQAFEPDFEQADAALGTALEQSPDDPDLRVAAGRIYAAWARARLEAGTDAAEPLERGLEQADTVLAARPQWPDAQVTRAELLLLQARTEDDPASRREMAGRAKQDFAQAFATNAALKTVWGEQAGQTRALVGTASP